MLNRKEGEWHGVREEEGRGEERDKEGGERTKREIGTLNGKNLKIKIYRNIYKPWLPLVISLI